MKHVYFINLLCIIFLIGYEESYSQNLVLNPSFEDVNISSLNCSWYTSQTQYNNAINFWTCPTGGSTDIFNLSLSSSCYCHPMSTHSSNPGQQMPRTGNGYCNIVTYGNGGCTPWREYVQGALSANLIAGQEYEVSFWVTLADKMSVGTNNIGVKFEVAPYYQSSNCPYYTTPELNYTGPIILDKTNWVQISFNYIPTVNGQSHFIIGNFYNDPATSTAIASGVRTGNTIRYYIEDVVIQPINLLPVDFVNVEANCMPSSVAINWTTASEINSYRFVIERSEDGLFFLPVSTIESVKNSSDQTSYTWDDTEPINGIAYYRIKQENQDGSERYSDIRSVTCTLQNNKNVTIFPNPFSDEVTVSIPDELNERITIQLFNTLGQLVEQTTFKSKIRHTWRFGKQFNAGMYVIRVDDGEAIFQQKMIKF